MSKSASRLGRVHWYWLAVSTLLACSCAVSAENLTFDELSEGPLQSRAYFNISFGGSAAVFNVSKANNAVRSTGAFNIDFDSPQQSVSVLVGNPGNIAGQFVHMTAYGAGKGAPPLASLSVYVTNSGPTRLLSLTRMLGRDIRAIRIEAAQVEIDDLTFQRDLDLGTVTQLNFDDADLVGRDISNQYPGIEVDTGAQNLATVRIPGVPTASPPNALITRVGEVGNPGAIKFWLNPPQGAVRFAVGNPWSLSDIQVTIRAYWLLSLPPLFIPMPLATNVVTIPAKSGVTNFVEINDWDNRNIQYVEVESSGNYWEAIDNLQFAPNSPLVTADVTAPVISGVTVNGQPSPLDLWRVSNQTNVSVRGTVMDAGGLRNMVVCSRNLASSAITTNSVTFYGDPDAGFTFDHGPVMVSPGTTEIWLVATDLSGNVSAPSAMQTVTLAYPQSSVTSVSPLTGAGSLGLRATGAYPAPNTRGITNAMSDPVVTIRGQKLHQHIRVSILTPFHAGGYIAHGLAITNRSADLSELTCVVPNSALAQRGEFHIQVTDEWPNNYHTNWSGTYTVTTDYSYPKLWGFGFDNKFYHGSFEPEYWSCFGWNAYTSDGFLGIGGCARTPLSWIFWPVYDDYAPRDGSCMGLAALSQLLYADYQITGTPPTFRFNPAVYYPNALVIDPSRNEWYDVVSNTPPSQAPGITWPSCSPPYPTDLWGTIRSHFAVQFSAEYIAEALDQIDFFDGTDTFFRGDPKARLEQLRTDDPTRYVLAMTPGSGGGGHAVAPYAVVGNRIYVADNNRPYTWFEPPNSPNNQAATNSYVEINPVSNTYSFPNLGWTGDGLYLIPVDVWRNQRHLPISFTGLMNMLQGWFFGSADPLYTSADGTKAFGWDTTGNFINTLPGVKAIPFFGSTNDNRKWVVLLPTNHLQINLEATLRSNAPYGFLAAWNGRLLQCETLDSAGNETARFGLSTVKSQLAGLSFQSPIENARFVPKLGRVDPATGKESVMQWGGLRLAFEQTVEVRLTDSPHAADLVNRGKQPLNPILVFESNEDPRGPTAASFGPFELPAGAALRVEVTEFTNRLRATAWVDATQTGEFVEIGTFNGQDLRPAISGAADCNRNGTADSIEIALGRSTDADHDGRPDDCRNAQGPRLEHRGFNDKGSPQFVVISEPGALLVIETSADLQTWTPVYTNNTSSGVLFYEHPLPLKSGEARFYRSRETRF